MLGLTGWSARVAAGHVRPDSMVPRSCRRRCQTQQGAPGESRRGMLDLTGWFARVAERHAAANLRFTNDDLPIGKSAATGLISLDAPKGSSKPAKIPVIARKWDGILVSIVG